MYFLNVKKFQNENSGKKLKKLVKFIKLIFLPTIIFFRRAPSILTAAFLQSLVSIPVK